MAKKWPRALQQIAALSLAAGLIGAIDHWLGWDRLLSPWTQLELLPLASALALVLASHALRALRFQRYFPQAHGVPFHYALQLVLRHNFLNNLLPMRSGEISFPLLAKRSYGVPVGEAVGGLLIFRLLDLHTIAWLGCAMLHLITGYGPWLALVLVLLILPLPARWLILRWQASPPRLPGFLRRTLDSVAAGLPSSKHTLTEAWWWTIAIWTGKIAAFAWLLTLLGELSLGKAWLGAIAGDLTSVLPFHGWAGAGTYEAGVVAALTPLGVAAEDALAMAVNLHLLILGTTLISGLVAFVLPGRSQSSPMKPSE